MAFCRYCGRELQEGEVCSCRDQGETPKTEVADAVSIQGKQIAGEAWKDFIRLLKSPASYAGSYVKSGNMVTAILFLVLQAICSSIFAVLCIGKINGLIGLGGSMTESLKFSSVGGFFSDPVLFPSSIGGFDSALFGWKQAATGRAQHSTGTFCRISTVGYFGAGKTGGLPALYAEYSCWDYTLLLRRRFGRNGVPGSGERRGCRAQRGSQDVSYYCHRYCVCFGICFVCILGFSHLYPFYDS